MDAARGFRGKVKERTDGAARCLTGLKFQYLAEQDQSDDDCSGFKVDRHGAMRRAQFGREQIRRNRRHHAVDPGCTCAERDQ